MLLQDGLLFNVDVHPVKPPQLLGVTVQIIQVREDMGQVGLHFGRSIHHCIIIKLSLDETASFGKGNGTLGMMK